jgi:hypothetical protein
MQPHLSPFGCLSTFPGFKPANQKLLDVLVVNAFVRIKGDTWCIVFKDFAS